MFLGNAGNSAPQYPKNSLYNIGIHQPVRQNFSGIDSFDRDSFSYRIVHTNSKRNIIDTFSSWSLANPISAYCPSGYPNCSPNPGASPPIGFYLDSMFGDNIFTPIDSGKFYYTR